MKPRMTLGIFVAAALVVALALAFFVSPQASNQPDGLNKVAIDKGFADNETAHALTDGPTAGYAVKGVDNDRLATGLAGLIGVTVTFAIAGGLFLVLRQTRRSTEPMGHGVT
jgi:hypothetical protein